MAFGDTVQAVENSVSSGIVTVNFTAATAGNLLIFGVGRSSTLASGATWGTPTGWTMLTSTPENTGNVGAVWYYKIASGGETSVSSSESTPPGNGRGIVMEFAGPFAASPLDVTAEDESNLATVVTSQPSGTTATTSQADALAIAFFVVDGAINADGGRSYSDSFSEVIYAHPVNFNNRAACVGAKRLLTATGTYSTTFSCTDTGDEMYGAIAVFKAQTGGGVSVTPGAASCISRTVAPIAILGSLTLTPTIAACIASTVAPNVVLGSIPITPVVAYATAGTAPPIVQYGSVVVSGSLASAVASTANPHVMGGAGEEKRNISHHDFPNLFWL